MDCITCNQSTPVATGDFDRDMAGCMAWRGDQSDGIHPVAVLRFTGGPRQSRVLVQR